MKTTLLMLSLWASMAVAFAQSQGFNTTLEASDYAFAPLDKSYVTSKILYDRVFHNADLQFFNTQTDTSSAQHFLQAYYELYLSNYNNSQVLTPQDIDDLIWTTQQYPAVQIGVLLAKFHRINYDVIEADSEGQYHLNNNYSYNDLYIEQDINVVSLLQSKIFTGVNFFQLPDWGIFSNRNVYPTSITIDFGDGLPIRTINPGVEPVSANYTTSGEKIINFTVNLNNGTQFTAKSKVFVIGGANPTPISSEFAKIAKTKQLQSPIFPYNDGISLVDSIRIQASIPFQGYNESSASKGAADVLTYYAAGRTTLQKPIVILDGFDPNDQNKGGYLYSQRLSYERNGIPAQLGNELRANSSLNGYDIVVVNFPNMLFKANSSIIVIYMTRFTALVFNNELSFSKEQELVELIMLKEMQE
ncbi:MAG: hypothetical protein U5N85_02945 [Arcicella sp.]|nr:hypothetical protein [Arcicella sp.]